MSKIFLLSFYFFLASLVFSQDSKSYFALINQAEFEIAHHRMNTATTYYEKAFSQNESGFAKDFFNCGVILLIQGEKEKALAALDSSILRGINLEELKRNNYTKKVTTDKTFSDRYETLHKVYENKINNNLSHTLKSAYQKDQAVRNFFNWQFRKTYVRRIDRQNFMLIDSLLKNRISFAEHKIGLITHIRFHSITTILSHNIHRLNDTLINELRRRVTIGEYHPYYFAKLMDRISLMKSARFTYYSFYGLGKVKGMSNFIDTTELNKNRLELELMSMDDALFILENAYRRYHLIYVV
jgi:nitrate/TMAO reductase-like tetraheme cytochrome c subunit